MPEYECECKSIDRFVCSSLCSCICFRILQREAGKTGQWPELKLSWESAGRGGREGGLPVSDKLMWMLMWMLFYCHRQRNEWNSNEFLEDPKTNTDWRVHASLSLFPYPSVPFACRKRHVCVIGTRSRRCLFGVIHVGRPYDLRPTHTNTERQRGRHSWRWGHCRLTFLISVCQLTTDATTTTTTTCNLQLGFAFMAKSRVCYLSRLMCLCVCVSLCFSCFCNWREELSLLCHCAALFGLSHRAWLEFEVVNGAFNVLQEADQMHLPSTCPLLAVSLSLSLCVCWAVW